MEVFGDNNDDSSDYNDDKPIEIDKEFIDDNTFEEVANFYRTIDNKKSRFDCTQVGKLKIDSESKEEQVEMNALGNGSHIPELDDSDDDYSLREVYKNIYGTIIMNGITTSDPTILLFTNLRKNIFGLSFKNLFVYLLRIINQCLDFLIWCNFIFLQTA